MAKLIEFKEYYSAVSRERILAEIARRKMEFLKGHNPNKQEYCFVISFTMRDLILNNGDREHAWFEIYCRIRGVDEEYYIFFLPFDEMSDEVLDRYNDLNKKYGQCQK